METALRKQPLTVLSKLPPTEESTVFRLLKEVQYYAVLEGNKDLTALMTKRAIRLSLQKKILSKDMVSILATHTRLLGQDITKAKLANAYGNAAEKASEVFREDKGLYSEVQVVLHGCVYPLLRPHRESMEPTIDAY
eukprot:15336548-Ditylum_brightwellii.AAC.1